MKRLLICLATGFGLPGLLAGCHGSAPAPPKRVNTGAEDAALAFFTALVNKDWPGAYARLDGKSKSGCSASQFEKQGKFYHENLGFEASNAYVMACSEKADSAIAHISIKGIQGSSVRYYKDAVALQRGAEGWGVTLPAHFGKKRPKA
jgi:hypothetical protein